MPMVKRRVKTTPPLVWNDEYKRWEEEGEPLHEPSNSVPRWLDIETEQQRAKEAALDEAFGETIGVCLRWIVYHPIRIIWHVLVFFLKNASDIAWVGWTFFFIFGLIWVIYTLSTGGN